MFSYYLVVIQVNVKKYRIKDIVLPYKKINYFVLGLIIFGIISGAIFYTIVSHEEKLAIIKQINNFITSISKNNLDTGLAFKNSLFSNGILVVLIWILGMSVIGMLVNIFIVYLKSFIAGFSIASIIGAYGIKGIPASFIYVFPGQIIDIIAISIMGIYSVIFSLYIIKLIIYKNNTNRNMLKKYMTIFILSLLLVLLAALFEAYFLPALMKLIISLYI